MLRSAALAGTFVLLCGAVLAAQDAPAGKKKETEAPRPVGKWTREAGDAKAEFHIHKSTLKCVITNGEKTITCDADYSVTKDGVLYGRVNKVEKKGIDNSPEVGALFSFRFALKDGTLTISELQAAEAEGARQLIEGEYTGGKKK
jgi:hypothetical protein